MGQRIAGTCYIKIDGAQLEIKGAMEAPVSEKKREGVVSATGVVGYKETVQPPVLKVTAIATRDFPLETLATNVDMTVTAEFANGKVYTLSGAWLSNDATVKADEGECELEFTGTRGVWL